jgi:hypothetical protein
VRRVLLHALISRDSAGEVSLKVTQPSVYRQPSKQYLPDRKVAATSQLPARMRRRERMRVAWISDGTVSDGALGDRENLIRWWTRGRLDQLRNAKGFSSKVPNSLTSSYFRHQHSTGLYCSCFPPINSNISYSSSLILIHMLRRHVRICTPHLHCPSS